jgi:UDP-glucose 4-epimerase
VRSPRRPGDAGNVVADPSLIKAWLAWRPEHEDLGEIVEHDYVWVRRLANGASGH